MYVHKYEKVESAQFPWGNNKGLIESILVFTAFRHNDINPQFHVVVHRFDNREVSYQVNDGYVFGSYPTYTDIPVNYAICIYEQPNNSKSALLIKNALIGTKELVRINCNDTGEFKKLGISDLIQKIQEFCVEASHLEQQRFEEEVVVLRAGYELTGAVSESNTPRAGFLKEFFSKFIS